MKTVLDDRLVPIIKYPGGKEKELKYIIPSLPRQIDRYYEPFVGGGAVYFSIAAEEYYINDRSDELIMLYRMVKSQNEAFFKMLEAMDHNWEVIGHVASEHKDNLIAIFDSYNANEVTSQRLSDIITGFVLENADEFNGLLKPDFNYQIERFVSELCSILKNKMIRMKDISKKKGSLGKEDIMANIESAMKAAFYTHFRYLGNHKEELGLTDEFATAIYFFIRQTCYSSMFRYNKDGEFNVPYGGISYNKKSFSSKIAQYKEKSLTDHLAKTIIGNMDFYDFMCEYRPRENDFIFVDPPYDTEFSTYAQNEFGKDDQSRLADYLIRECEGNFMLVIKNTDYIRSLYPEGTDTANGGRTSVFTFDKKYQVSFRDRNNKDAEHLLITNYDVALS